LSDIKEELDMDIAKEQVRQDLEAAVSVIEEKGWCRHRLQDDEGRVCALGALHTAVTGHYWWPESYEWPASDGVTPTRTTTSLRVDAAREALYAAVPEIHNGSFVADWNNAQEDVQVVIDGFRQAIKSLIEE
jgi:hypothetical protein